MQRIHYIIILFSLIFGGLCCVKKKDIVIDVPVTPADLKGEVISGSQIKITWTDKSTNEKGFKIQRKTGTGSFSDIASLGADTTSYNDTSLTRSTTYTYRVYAFNEAGSSLSHTNEESFSTWGDIQLTTENVTGIYFNFAKSGGNITSDGGSPVKDRGVVWSMSPNPTVSLKTITSSGSGIGKFSSDLYQLMPNRVYFVRAYATNSEATFYGNELTFTSSSRPPQVNLPPPEEITSTSAKIVVYVYDESGDISTDLGIFWGTTPNPDDSLKTKTSFPLTSCHFQCNPSMYLNGLIPNTTYYVQAYYANRMWRSYSSTISFKTFKSSPKLTTTIISDITRNSAKSGGNITSDGGDPIIDRGVVWNSWGSPNIFSQTKTSNGSGIGTFTSNLSNLTPNTPYYVRAYVTNSLGTFYGNEIYFMTPK